MGPWRWPSSSTTRAPRCAHPLIVLHEAAPCIPTYSPLSPQDLQLFQEDGGWAVVSAVAEFWCSRVVWSPEEEKYHLRGELAAGSGGSIPNAKLRHRLALTFCMCPQGSCLLTSTTRGSTTPCTPT